MELQPILHVLVWTLFLKIAGAHEGQDATRSIETGDIYHGSVFMHCQNFADYDRAFAIMRQQRLLVERAEQPDHEFICYDLELGAGTLREHLEATGVLEGTDSIELTRCFLKLASEPDGSTLCQSLPIGRVAAPIPTHFADAVNALNAAGFCLVSEGRMSWLPKVGDLMEAEGIWVQGRPAHEVNRERLAAIWDAMPDDLKMSVMDQQGRVNAISLFTVMRHHWHPQLGWGDHKKNGWSQPNVSMRLAEMLNTTVLT